MNNQDLVKTLKTAGHMVGDNTPLSDLLTTAAQRIKEMSEVISNAYVAIKVGMPEFNLDDALYILEPYVKEGMPDAFDSTIPGDLETARLDDVGYHISLLEKYPKIKFNLEAWWGTPRGRKYLVGLVVDDRDRHHTRVQGFPKKILSTLSRLVELHDRVYPQFIPQTTVWDSII